MDNTKEYIICAAIHYQFIAYKIVHQVKNIQSGVVVCGHRHHNIIELVHELTGLTTKDSATQGFLTSKNRFVDRFEGFQVAVFADQVKPELCQKWYNHINYPATKAPQLYSEDIY